MKIRLEDWLDWQLPVFLASADDDDGGDDGGGDDGGGDDGADGGAADDGGDDGGGVSDAGGDTAGADTGSVDPGTGAGNTGGPSDDSNDPGLGDTGSTNFSDTTDSTDTSTTGPTDTSAPGGGDTGTTGQGTGGDTTSWQDNSGDITTVRDNPTGSVDTIVPGQGGIGSDYAANYSVDPDTVTALANAPAPGATMNDLVGPGVTGIEVDENGIQTGWTVDQNRAPHPGGIGSDYAADQTPAPAPAPGVAAATAPAPDPTLGPGVNYANQPGGVMGDATDQGITVLGAPANAPLGYKTDYNPDFTPSPFAANGQVDLGLMSGGTPAPGAIPGNPTGLGPAATGGLPGATPAPSTPGGIGSDYAIDQSNAPAPSTSISGDTPFGLRDPTISGPGAPPANPANEATPPGPGPAPSPAPSPGPAPGPVADINSSGVGNELNNPSPDGATPGTTPTGGGVPLPQPDTGAASLLNPIPNSPASPTTPGGSINVGPNIGPFPAIPSSPVEQFDGIPGNYNPEGGIFGQPSAPGTVFIGGPNIDPTPGLGGTPAGPAPAGYSNPDSGVFSALNSAVDTNIPGNFNPNEGIY